MMSLPEAERIHLEEMDPGPCQGSRCGLEGGHVHVTALSLYLSDGDVVAPVLPPAPQGALHLRLPG